MVYTVLRENPDKVRLGPKINVRFKISSNTRNFLKIASILGKYYLTERWMNYLLMTISVYYNTLQVLWGKNKWFYTIFLCYWYKFITFLSLKSYCKSYFAECKNIRIIVLMFCPTDRKQGKGGCALVHSALAEHNASWWGSEGASGLRQLVLSHFKSGSGVGQMMVFSAPSPSHPVQNPNPVNYSTHF